MMTSFDASGLPDVPRKTLRDLRSELGDFVLVGMAAVDLVARAVADLPAPRLTRDVDVAIAVDSQPELRERTRRLVPRGPSPIHFWLDGAQIDVVPYGAVAPDDRLVLSDAELDVSGLADAARTSISIRLDDDLVVRVASLHALVALKLIAWTDRGPATDDKDAHDVGLLLRASVSGSYLDQLWSDDEALATVKFDPERAGPYRVGRQIARDFEQSLVERLHGILTGRSGTRLRDLLRRPLSGEQLDALLLGLEQGPGSATDDIVVRST